MFKRWLISHCSISLLFILIYILRSLSSSRQLSVNDCMLVTTCSHYIILCTQYFSCAHTIIYIFSNFYVNISHTNFTYISFALPDLHLYISLITYINTLLDLHDYMLSSTSTPFEVSQQKRTGSLVSYYHIPFAREHRLPVLFATSEGSDWPRVT